LHRFFQVSMTLIKYTPQALLNRDRQSTEGWSINNVLLDLSGGLLSFAQVGLNAFARGDLSVITGESVGLWEGGGAFGSDVCKVTCLMQARGGLRDLVFSGDPGVNISGLASRRRPSADTVAAETQVM
jgi:hypothetical protein